jgi:hypothetical protein
MTWPSITRNQPLTISKIGEELSGKVTEKANEATDTVKGAAKKAA